MISWRRIAVLAIPLVPVTIGLLAAVVVESGPLPNHVLVIDLPAAFFWAGVLISVITAAFTLLWEFRRQRADSRSRLELENALRERDNLVRGIRHEIKNPLLTVMGEIDLVQTYGTLQERDQRSLAVMRDSVRRTSMLISQLSDLTHLKERCHPQRTGVSPIIEDAVREAIQSNPDRESDITVASPDGTAGRESVRVDYDLMVEALRNVIDNAFKYSKPGDPVTVSYWTFDGKVNIEVSDSGSGVPADEVPELTRELYRGEFARAHGIPGLGLGLAFVRRVVDLHDGRLDIRRRSAPGESGLVVRTVLPEIK
jgi:signal transduction histidine kinase